MNNKRAELAEILLSIRSDLTNVSGQAIQYKLHLDAAGQESVPRAQQREIIELLQGARNEMISSAHHIQQVVNLLPQGDQS